MRVQSTGLSFKAQAAIMSDCCSSYTPAPALHLCCSSHTEQGLSVQAGVITRSQHSRAQQEGCPEALLGGFSPPMRRRGASNEGDSQHQGSTLSDSASKTAGVVSYKPGLRTLQESVAS